MADRSKLEEPFHVTDVAKRPDGYSYVKGGLIIDRIIQASEGVYDWELTSLTLQNDGKKNFWLAVGKLTIPGLGSRCGSGTATTLNEDAPKSAEKDAFKRAAVLFGVALQLYKDDEVSYGDGPEPPYERKASPQRQGERQPYQPARATGQQPPRSAPQPVKAQVDPKAAKTEAWKELIATEGFMAGDGGLPPGNDGLEAARGFIYYLTGKDVPLVSQMTIGDIKNATLALKKRSSARKRFVSLCRSAYGEIEDPAIAGIFGEVLGIELNPGDGPDYFSADQWNHAANLLPKFIKGEVPA